jgi:hypothetical protein
VEQAGVLALAAAAPLVTLAVDPWGWFPFGPVKWLALTTTLLGGAALVLRHVRRPLRRHEPAGVRRRPHLGARGDDGRRVQQPRRRHRRPGDRGQVDDDPSTLPTQTALVGTPRS